MFQMMGVFAEFERSMIRERVKAGIARVRAEGKTFGRPRVSSVVETAIREALAKGTGRRKIASQLGVGVSVVQRIAGTPSRQSPIQVESACTVHQLASRRPAA